MKGYFEALPIRYSQARPVSTKAARDDCGELLYITGALVSRWATEDVHRDDSHRIII